jgi:hypothetical protein
MEQDAREQLQTQLDHQIHELEEWVNLLPERIANNMVPDDVRNRIQEEFDINNLKTTISNYRINYNNHIYNINQGTRIDHEVDTSQAVKTAIDGLTQLNGFITTFNDVNVSPINNMLPPIIQGGRHVRKRGRENLSRSSSARKYSSTTRRRRSSKRCATSRKQQKRRRTQ